jgi:hypothetical protein
MRDSATLYSFSFIACRYVQSAHTAQRKKAKRTKVITFGSPAVFVPKDPNLSNRPDPKDAVLK